MNTYNEPELDPMPELDNTPSEAQVWQWLDALASHYLARYVAETASGSYVAYLHGFAFKLYRRVSEREAFLWWTSSAGDVVVQWRHGGEVVFCSSTKDAPMGSIHSGDTYLIRPGVIATAPDAIRDNWRY